MSKNRVGIFIAVGVFALLLAVAWLTRSGSVNHGVRHLARPSVAKADIVSIELSGPKSALLKKSAEGWTVSELAHPEQTHAADSAQIEPLLAGLADLKAPDFVSSRPESQAQYEVDPAKGERVKLSTGQGVVLDLFFGKPGTRGGFYVRLADSNDIFWSPTQIGWSLKRSASELRARGIVTVPPETLRELSVEPAGRPAYTLSRPDATAPWAITAGAPKDEGFRFDVAAAARTAQAMTDLRAQEFLAPEKVNDAALGFDKPHAVLKAKTADGKVTELHIGSPPDPDATRIAGLLQDTARSRLLNRGELEKMAAQKDHPQRDAAANLLKDTARFQWLDAGAWSGRPADGTLSTEDLDAVVRGASLVPVRATSNPEVFLVGSGSTEALRRPVEGLRDVSMFAFDAAQIEKLVVTSNGKATVSLSRAGGAWTVVEPKAWPNKEPFDPSRVGLRLNELKQWRALRIAENVTPAQAGLSGTPTQRLQITLADKSVQTFKLGKALPGKPTTEHYAQGAMDSKVYIVPDSFRSTLAQGPTLFEKAPPPPSFSGAQGLDSLPPDVRRQLEAMRAKQGR